MKVVREGTMKVVPFVHEGLGNSSYLVGMGTGRALLVDPDRTVQRYLDEAKAHGWTIAAVLETHLHADFVSGAHEVAAATGATLFLPRDAAVRLPHEPVEASQRITLDGLEIEAVGSPGHTPEHLSYAMRVGGRPPALFSGGSLIVGGAARTDLISPEMTEPLTRAQYRTLTAAFTSLPDETVLYPTHGGGSFCSAGNGGGRTSTLGQERASNPAMGIETEEAFVRWFPATFPAAPAYYFRMRAFNAAGPRLRRQIAGPPALSPSEFKAAMDGGAIVVDARPVEAYAEGHIPGALSIAFRDVFAVWLGWLVAEGTPLLFVADGVDVERVVDEALLVGHERFAGVLARARGGGMTAWEADGLPVAGSRLVGAAEARASVIEGATVLDVRERDEYAAGHVPEAVHIPLGELAGRVDEVPGDRPVVAYCGQGERSGTAVSILERAGRTEVVNLDGGIAAWTDAGFGVSS